MRYVLPLLGVLMLTGCFPQTDVGLNGKPVTTRDADRQYKARLLQLQDGKTTRDEVLSIMGDPDQTDEANRAMMYYWSAREKDSENIVRAFVIVQFDAKGVLTRHQQYDHSSALGGLKVPEDAMAEFLAPPGK